MYETTPDKIFQQDDDEDEDFDEVSEEATILIDPTTGDVVGLL